MKCIKLTTALLLFNLAVFGNIESSLAFYDEYELKIELENRLKENELFISALGAQESSSNPDTVNSIGAMGMWQFMPYTLKHLGYGHITLQKFIKDPSVFPLYIQREALDKKFNEDLKELQDQWFRKHDINYLEKYVGKSFLGIDTVTVAGLLAACHLGGVYGTIRFLDSKGLNNPEDVYGSSIYYYLKKFSKYKYNIEKPIKEELQCLKLLEKDFQNITLLLKQSKLYTLENLLKGTETVWTLFKLRRLQHQEVRDYQELLSLWDLKRSYLNTTEVYCTLGAAPLLSMGLLLEMELEKLNGTMQENGKGLYGHTKIPDKFLKVLEYSNSTSNQSGMLLGMLKYHTYSPNFGFRRLKNYPHLGVG